MTWTDAAETRCRALVVADYSALPPFVNVPGSGAGPNVLLLSGRIDWDSAYEALVPALLPTAQQAILDHLPTPAAAMNAATSGGVANPGVVIESAQHFFRIHRMEEDADGDGLDYFTEHFLTLTDDHASDAPAHLAGALDPRTRSAELQWPLGPASSAGGFDVQRQVSGSSFWQTAGTVAASAVDAGNLLHFSDSNLVVGKVHSYRVRYSIFGHHSIASNIVALDGWLDGDGDGLPDAWERFYFDSLAYGPADDPDRDGITNAAEFAAGSNPAASAAAHGLQLMRRGVMAYAVNPGHPRLGGVSSDTHYLSVAAHFKVTAKHNNIVTLTEEFDLQDVDLPLGQTGKGGARDKDNEHTEKWTVTHPATPAQDETRTLNWTIRVPALAAGREQLGSFLSLDGSRAGESGDYHLSLSPSVVWADGFQPPRGRTIFQVPNYPGLHTGTWEGDSTFDKTFFDGTLHREAELAGAGSWTGTATSHTDGFPPDTVPIASRAYDEYPSQDKNELTPFTVYPPPNLENTPTHADNTVFTKQTATEIEYTNDSTNEADTYHLEGWVRLTELYTNQQMIADVAGAMPAWRLEPGWTLTGNVAQRASTGIGGVATFAPDYVEVDGYPETLAEREYWPSAQTPYVSITDCQYWFETDDRANTPPVTWAEWFEPRGGAPQLRGLHTWDPATAPICPIKTFLASQEIDPAAPVSGRYYISLLPFEIEGYKRGTINAPGAKVPKGTGKFGYETVMLENADFQDNPRQQRDCDSPEVNKTVDDDFVKVVLKWPKDMKVAGVKLQLRHDGMEVDATKTTFETAVTIKGTNRLNFYKPDGTKLTDADLVINDLANPGTGYLAQIFTNGELPLFIEGADKFGYLGPDSPTMDNVGTQQTAAKKLGGAILRWEVTQGGTTSTDKLLVYRGGFFLYQQPTGQPGTPGLLTFYDGKGRVTNDTTDYGEQLAQWVGKSGKTSGGDYDETGRNGHIPPGWRIVFQRTDFTDKQRNQESGSGANRVIRQGGYCRWQQDDAAAAAGRYITTYEYHANNAHDVAVGEPTTVKFKFQTEAIPPTSAAGRSEIQIHPDGWKDGTAGCIGIQDYSDVVDVFRVLTNYHGLKLKIELD